MPNKHDQRCTPRSQDWHDLFTAIGCGLRYPFMAVKARRNLRPLPDPPRIGHELKNVVREEWRRWTGKCPKEDESKESGV